MPKCLSNVTFAGAETVDGVDISAHAANVTTAHLPSQTDQSGKFLTTDGTSSSWVVAGGLPDQTGHAGAVLYSTNGTSSDWVNLKESLYLSAGGMNPSTATPAGSPSIVQSATNKISRYEGTFAASANSTGDSYADWMVPMPDNYDGSTVTAKCYFEAPAGTLTDGLTVIFKVAGLSIGGGEAIDQAPGTGQNCAYTMSSDTAGDMLVTPVSAAITLAGTPAGGEMVAFRVNRDVDDTFASTVNLIGIKVYYTTNSPTE